MLLSLDVAFYFSKVFSSKKFSMQSSCSHSQTDISNLTLWPTIFCCALLLLSPFRVSWYRPMMRLPFVEAIDIFRWKIKARQWPLIELSFQSTKPASCCASQSQVNFPIALSEISSLADITLSVLGFQASVISCACTWRTDFAVPSSVITSIQRLLARSRRDCLLHWSGIWTLTARKRATSCNTFTVWVFRFMEKELARSMRGRIHSSLRLSTRLGSFCPTFWSIWGRWFDTRTLRIKFWYQNELFFTCFDVHVWCTSFRATSHSMRIAKIICVHASLMERTTFQELLT